MSNKQVMRIAGRKIRRAFDKYIAEIEAAIMEGVDFRVDRVVTETIDGVAQSRVVPDPSVALLGDVRALLEAKFTFRVTETLEESELDDETVEETPAA